MLLLTKTPLPSFSSAESELYGSSKKPIVLTDSDDEVEEEEEPDEDVVVEKVRPKLGETQTQILEDVIYQSGHVIINNVLTQPKDMDWWSQLSKDVESLRGTNNCVPILNGPGRDNDFARHQIMFTE